MRDFTFTLAAGDTREFREKGSYFLVTATTQTLKIATLDNRVRRDNVTTGQGFRNLPFNSVTVTNPSAVDATVTVTIAENSEVLDAVRVVGAVANAPATGYTAGSDLTVTSTPETLTLPAGCRGVIFTAAHGNTDLINVAGTPLDAGQAVPLELGPNVVVTYSATSGTQGLYWTILTGA